MSREFVYGFNVVETLAEQAPDRVVRLFVDRKRRDGRVQNLLHRLAAHRVASEFVAADKLGVLSDGAHHQGLVAEVRKLPVLDDGGVFNRLAGCASPFLCVLDSVQDPRNLGACLRTAEAANVNIVILSRHDSCGITPVVRQVSAGAAELIPIARVSNLVRVLKRLQNDYGIWVIGAAGDADHSIYEIDLSGPLAMVFGSEGKGLKRLTRESCDRVGHIPLGGKIDSLNVSVAVGIGLFEAVRQRNAGNMGNLPGV